MSSREKGSRASLQAQADVSRRCPGYRERLLDYRVEHAPEEYRESMLKNVRLNREIMDAWAEHVEKAVEEDGAD